MQAAEEVNEAAWAFKSHMASPATESDPSSALLVAVELARSTERLDELLEQALSEPKRAIRRRGPRRNHRGAGASYLDDSNGT